MRRFFSFHFTNIFSYTFNKIKHGRRCFMILINMASLKQFLEIFFHIIYLFFCFVRKIFLFQNIHQTILKLLHFPFNMRKFIDIGLRNIFFVTIFFLLSTHFCLCSIFFTLQAFLFLCYFFLFVLFFLLKKSIKPTFNHLEFTSDSFFLRSLFVFCSSFVRLTFWLLHSLSLGESWGEDIFFVFSLSARAARTVFCSSFVRLSYKLLPN